MKIWANQKLEVNIDPIDVITNLIEKEIGDGWVIKEGDKYYLIIPINRLIEDKEEISKETYDYIINLQNVLKTLKDKNK